MRHPASSFVLVTIDCLRADHVGFLGYSRNTTPFLDSLAAESFVFKNAMASGVPTYYSLPALLGSRYPLALGRDVIGIAPGENTLASELSECGFRTAAFLAANPYISTAFGYEGGFEVFRDFLSGSEVSRVPTPESGVRHRTNRMLSRACHSVPLLGAAYDELYFQYCQRAATSDKDSLESLRRFPAADVIVDCASAWLDENSGGPFFLWLHLMDPHAPYYPKLEALQDMDGEITASEAKYLNSFWQRTDLGTERLQTKRDAIVSLYDAGVHWADAQIRRLVQKLRELKAWDQCALAFTADHGEEFLEHGGRFHSPLKLTEELVHVPLLLRVPSYSERCDLESPIGLIDVAPTVFDLLDLPAPASFRGRSCWRSLTNGWAWDWPVFTECASGCSNPLDVEKRYSPRLLAVRRRDYKLVIDFASGTDSLYHISSDPHERRPLAAGEARELRKDLLNCARKHVAESCAARNFDLSLGCQLREFRLKHSIAGRPN